MKCRASFSHVSSSTVFTLFYYLFFCVANTCFRFCQILFCKLQPPVLVIFRKFLFGWRTVLMLLPSQELNGSLSTIFLKDLSITSTTTMSLIIEFFSSLNSQTRDNFFNWVRIRQNFGLLVLYKSEI